MTYPWHCNKNILFWESLFLISHIFLIIFWRLFNLKQCPRYYCSVLWHVFYITTRYIISYNCMYVCRWKKTILAHNTDRQTAIKGHNYQFCFNRSWNYRQNHLFNVTDHEHHYVLVPIKWSAIRITNDLKKQEEFLFSFFVFRYICVVWFLVTL